ncbi:MAG: hypothetical protein LC674_02630, partial [Actinobacteria bacterium]|nr:hypothetical protein [Actinomycetota bacterium]
GEDQLLGQIDPAHADSSAGEVEESLEVVDRQAWSATSWTFIAWVTYPTFVDIQEALAFS